jgi:glycosyltransferase involved in cell wall biosynthesis
LNILYVSNKKGWGGVVSRMHRLALGLERRGHRSWIVAHPRSRFVTSEPSGIRIIPKRLGMDYNPLVISYLAYFMRHNRVDVVVTNIKKEVIAGGIAARMAGISNVRLIGSPDDLGDDARWYQEKLVDHSVLPADAILKQAMEKVDWLDPATFTTIYNGRNPTAYSEREIDEHRHQWGISREHLAIGCTSHLSTVKGIDRLIAVFARVLERHDECRLVLTGEGLESGRLRGLARELGVADRVVFAGFSGDPMKADAAYDIAILNSSAEGFPNVIVEYFAVGRPVICTDVGGISEMVEDGRNGLMIPPGDDDALLARILLLIENQDLRLRLGRNALETLKQGFTEDAMIDGYEHLFGEMAGKRGR